MLLDNGKVFFAGGTALTAGLFHFSRTLRPNAGTFAVTGSLNIGAFL